MLKAGEGLRMRKSIKIILIIAAAVIAIRLVMPYFIKEYVNKTLNELEGYRGGIEDIDLALIRGAYVIKNLRLENEATNDTIPVVDIEKIDFSVEWKALFKGSIVGEVIIENPEINLMPPEEEKEEEEEAEPTDWVQTLKDLIPLRINRFAVEDGKINFIDFQTSPKVEVYFDSLFLTVSNISNVESKDVKLPSSVYLSATSIGGGKIELNLDANFLKHIPDVDGDLSFEDINMTAFNEVTQAYGKFDLESGSLSLYSEMVINDGILDGYIKPFFENIKIAGGEEDESFWRKAWEGFLDLFTEALENQPRDQVATRIPIQGDLNNPKAPILVTVLNIFRNAFIEAFQQQLEGSVELDVNE